MIRKIIKYGILTVVILAAGSYAIYKVHQFHQMVELALEEPLKMDCVDGMGLGIGRISHAVHPFLDNKGKPVACYKEDGQDDEEDEDDAPAPVKPHVVRPSPKDEVTL